MTLFPRQATILSNYEICNDAKISSCLSAGSAVAAAAIGPLFFNHTLGMWRVLGGVYCVFVFFITA
jgi:hypothetical protein